MHVVMGRNEVKVVSLFTLVPSKELPNSSDSNQIDVLFVKLTVLFINMQTLKLKSHLHNCVFCCRQSITIISNEPWNSETHKRDWNPPITNLKPRPFEPIRVKFCFLRGPIKMLDSSEKHNHHLAFALQNSHVCEKRSIKLNLMELDWRIRFN